MTAPPVVPLTAELGAADRASAGGKAVGLAALLRAGLTVPPTWVVPVGALPSAAELAGLAEVAPRWAVRSSATIEDGAALSYAGMFRSELDVPVGGLAAAVARVQASARSRRVAAYRAWTGAGEREVGMAVLLQPFRPPSRSGLWLGRGLATGRLEWVPGGGEPLVSGAVTPSWEEWAPAGLVAGGESGVLTAGGTPVGAACAAVQRALGTPADLEFALLDGVPSGSELVWLQYRPMTRELTGDPTREPAGGAGPEEPGDAVVRGVPASPGQADGRVVLLRDASDPEWSPGTVLLTERTDPDWVPLMAEAAALVTAAGGMLCHAAIVARELGVPCVTGVGAAALARLAAGETVSVDGTAGTVSIVD
ncbi:pyruvate, water dikinase [Amycolatopsis arida]|uniref:Phosphoenolpyruvate synthase n=1 Tax=Amycolatopsis arida TaxID=587909 RepID=A0A1I5V6U9_9PSEU|nr:PEP-utilizing enzyme [Amycolatopsis arida]TDX91173.1 pyruvate,water dikinase [Amycolatopsis arida]SFQ03253.1 pyruvate, water dikinase [Amycolatopsis arida]